MTLLKREKMDLMGLNHYVTSLDGIIAIFTHEYKGGFHLYLLVFPFVYQFNSRIGVLVKSSFAND